MVNGYVGDLDGRVELGFAFDGGDEVGEVGVGHGVDAEGVSGAGGFAGAELVDLLALPVVDVVAVAVDDYGALGSHDGGAAVAVVDFHALAATAFPGDGLVGISEVGDEGVVELPVVLELVAAAGGG